ncbi:MAG: hypothetical protein ACK5L0_04015 [Candidatus Fimivivens sp.]
MKELLLGLSAIFALLTFIGMIYVLTSDGRINAGYSIIPMLFSLIFCQLAQSVKWKK